MQSAAAQNAEYPARTVTLVTPFAPGNAPDVLVRALAEELNRETRQNFVVESKPGAGTLLAAQTAAKAPADGYTVFISGITTFAANRHLFRKLPYDPVKDFQPVTALAKGPNVLLVNAKLPVKSVPELIALAKQQPGKLTYGDATAVTQVLGDLLQRRTGIKLTRVPYKSSTQALPDLIGGQIDLLFTDLTALRYVKDGKLKALAISDSKRSALAPEVPTLEEVGVKDSEVGFILEVVVPAGTPMPIVERIRALVSKAAHQPKLEQIYTTGGMYLYLTTPGELAQLNEREAARWGDMVKAAGIETQ
ncbi:MAG TPA: tripartite tricarboxylate transporter substrate binding protein [Ramlibacter sp.]|nr:tripartite tricarboxylate transporter substrate binding protein [Ramlibacter sp.]